MKLWVAIPLAPIGYALVDRSDMARVVRHRWRRKAGVPVARIGAGDVRLSRFLTRAAAGARVVAVNGDAFDCRRENLRCSTPARVR